MCQLIELVREHGYPTSLLYFVSFLPVTKIDIVFLVGRKKDTVNLSMCELGNAKPESMPCSFSQATNPNP